MRYLILILFLTFLKIGEAKTLVISKNEEIKNIDKQDLLNIFTGKKQKWRTGEKIIVFVKPYKTLEHRDFTYSIFGISPNKFKELTVKNKLIFEVSSDEEIIMKVLEIPGSIGYVNYYEDFDKDLNFLN